ncbi:hypothetical protein BpHYR1_020436 [Brachionus plicatilis]|uniref:Uncharacterized protein n=1 Tax=Brachionus plicatilis TaxID=10195 RepID=A0A3M7RF95_BRAPC|nr:hypothetical protein BpHYR1_020436 [Brachionus plicatilis]
MDYFKIFKLVLGLIYEPGILSRIPTAKTPTTQTTWYGNIRKTLRDVWSNNQSIFIITSSLIFFIAMMISNFRRQRAFEKQIHESINLVKKISNNNTPQFICSNVNANANSTTTADTHSATSTTNQLTSNACATFRATPTTSTPSTTTSRPNTQLKSMTTADVHYPCLDTSLRLNSTPITYSDTRNRSDVMNPSAPNASISSEDSTFQAQNRRVRFADERRSEYETISTNVTMFPFIFIKPPEKFDAKRKDVRTWIKEFDLFIQGHNITNNKMKVVLS